MTINICIPGCRVKVEISFPLGLLSFTLSANSLVNKMFASFELPKVNQSEVFNHIFVR